MSGGAAFFPLRNTRWSCSEQSVDLDVVRDCDPSVPGNQYSEGFGIDFSALATLADRSTTNGCGIGLRAESTLSTQECPGFMSQILPSSIRWRFGLREVSGRHSVATPHFLMRRFVRLQTWGSERSDGPSILGRTLAGVGVVGSHSTGSRPRWFQSFGPEERFAVRTHPTLDSRRIILL